MKRMKSCYVIYARLHCLYLRIEIVVLVRALCFTRKFSQRRALCMTYCEKLGVLMMVGNF